MSDESGIGIAKQVSEDVGNDYEVIGPLPYFTHCTEIHNSKAPDLPEVMDEESIQAEERRLFGHPAFD